MSDQNTLILIYVHCAELPVQETAERVAGFLRGLGADLVLDLKLAEDWSILELQREMVTRYNQRAPGSR